MKRSTFTNSYELGRRLGYQGPRQTVGNQAVIGDKFTTGKQRKIIFPEKKRGERKRKGKLDHTDKNTQTLNVLQLNICGLRNKKLELAKVLNNHRIHIAALQETLHQNLDLHITGYTSYACGCNGCRGIVTYIRNDIQGDVIQLSASHPTDVQRVNIWHSGNKYTIYNVYSPPQTTCNIPELYKTQYLKTLLVGDFNGHSPRWGYPDYNSTGKYIEDICDVTNLSVLQNTESPPTLLHRVHLSLSRPDLTICSSDLIEISHSRVLEDIGSDHRPLLTTISIYSKTRYKQRTRWNFRGANWRLFRETSDRLLMGIDNNCVEKFSEELAESILSAASKSIPRGSRKAYKPFWNKEIQTAIFERNKARKTLEIARSLEAKIHYNKSCARVKLTVKKAKKR